MGKKIKAFIVQSIMLLALISASYIMTKNIPKQNREPQKVVYIYGDKPLAKAFAKIFESRGYKVVILEQETPTTQNKKVRIRADTEPPQVEITNPANRSYVSGNTSLTILASDNVSVDTVMLYIGGQLKKTWSGAGTFTYYWNTTAYSDGTYNVTVWANDTSGNTNSTYYEFTVDNTEPSVTISSPSQGAYLGSSDVTVSWTGSDNFQIDHYEISLDGQTPIDKGTSTSHTFTGVPDGDHNVTVYVYDKAGNINFDIVYFTVDTQAPTVTIVEPTAGSWFNIKNVTVSWTANDTGSGIDHYEVRIDAGTWINVGLNTSYTFINIGEGSHTVDVRAYDKAGNTGLDTTNFGVDTVAPTVTISDPSDGAYVNTSDVAVTWTGSDATSGIDHYEVRCYNSTWDTGWINVGTSTTHTFTNLADGQYTIYVKAIDLAGNVGVDSITITIDTEAPTVTIIAPANNSVVGGSVDIQVSSSDPHPDKTWLTINGSVVQTWDGDGNFTYSWDTTTYVDDVYEIVAYANDTVGNTGSCRILVTVDNTAPDVNIVDPYDGAYVNGVVTIIFNASDPNNVSLVELYIDGVLKYSNDTDYSSATYTYDWDTSTELEGNHTINVTAYDVVGNANSVEITVCVDRTPPSITITSPANNTEFNSSSDVTIQWTASDNNELDKFEVYLNGSLKATLPGDAVNYTFYDLSNGGYNATVIAYDKAGNTDSDYVVFTVNVPYSVTIEQPANDTWTNESWVLIQINYVNQTSTVMNITLYINDVKEAYWEKGENLTRPIQYNYSIPSEGLYNITAVMKDDIGQVATDTVWIHVDWTLPTVTIDCPADGSYVSGVVDINVTANDANFDRSELFIGGTSVVNWTTPGTNTYSWDTTTYTDGVYVIEARAWDLAGNMDSAQITVTVDNTPPTVIITSPANNSTVGTTFTVYWNAQDNASYIDIVYVYLNKSLEATYVYGSNMTNNHTFTGLSAPAIYNVTVEVVDAVGFTAVDTIWVHTVPLSVQITSPSDGYVTNMTWINLTWTATGDIDHFEIYRNGTLINGSIPASVTSYNVSLLNQEDAWNITILAVGTSGSSASDMIIVYTDFTPPSVEFLAPSDGSYVCGVVNVMINATDEHFDGSELYINSNLVQNWTTEGVNTYSWDTTTYADGIYVLTLKAYDKAGNSASISITVTVDNTVPIVTIDSPANNSTVGGIVDINVTAIENNLDRTELLINGTSMVNWTTNGTNTYPWDTASWSEDIYNITAVAIDLAGNINSTYILVTLDKTPPSVTIDSPADGSYVSGVIDINVTANDANFDRSELFIGGTSVVNWTTPGTNTYSWDTTTYMDGVYVIEARAYDLAGNMDSAQITITVDNTPPSVDIRAPDNNSFVSGNVDIRVVVNEINLDHVDLYINGSLNATWTESDHTYTWNSTVYPDGTNVPISAVAYDLAGNMDNETIFVTVDNTPPSVQIISPDTGSWFNVVNITVSWVGNDTLAGIAYYEISVDSPTGYMSVGTETSYNVTNLSEGQHIIYVRAWDNANNYDTSSIMIYIDLTSPVVQITYIDPYGESEGVGYTTMVFDMGFNWSDTPEFGQNITINIYLDDTLLYNHTYEGQPSGSEPKLTFDVSNITNISCRYNLTVRAYDQVGWEGIDYRWIEIIALKVQIKSPENESYINSSSIDVMWEYLPNGNKINNVTILVDGETIYTTSENITTYTVSGLSADTWHNITIFIADNKNNTATDTVFVFVDTTPPTVQITSPTEGETIFETNVTVQWTTSDNVEVVEVYIRIDGASWIDVTGLSSHVFENLEVGDHTVDLKAIDIAGNVGKDSVTFTISMIQKPVIEVGTMGWALEVGYFNTTNVSLIINVTAYAEFTLTIMINGTVNVTDVYSESVDLVYNLTIVDEGVYNITIVAEDIFGNKDVKVQMIYIDLTAPVIEISSPAENAEITGTSVKVEGTVIDNLSGIYSIEVKIGDKPWTSVSVGEDGSFSYTFTGLTNGTYTIYVKATDKAGNVATDSVSFKVVVITTSPTTPTLPIELIALALVFVIALVAVVALRRKKKAAPPTESEAAEALREVAEAI